jgi:hypothetical protein
MLFSPLFDVVPGEFVLPNYGFIYGSDESQMTAGGRETTLHTPVVSAVLHPVHLKCHFAYAFLCTIHYNVVLVAMHLAFVVHVIPTQKVKSEYPVFF